MYAVHRAKANLSKLLKEGENGKQVVIARGKRPFAKLVAIVATQTQRKPGRYKNVIPTHSSFYEPMTKRELED